jgi:hypothetical protein
MVNPDVIHHFYCLLLSLTVVCPGVVERAHPAAVEGLVRRRVMMILLMPMLKLLKTVQMLYLLDDHRDALLQGV